MTSVVLMDIFFYFDPISTELLLVPEYVFDFTSTLYTNHYKVVIQAVA